MKSGLSSSAALLPGIVAAALLGASARADVVTDWNVIANALVAKDVGNNPKLRTLAMVHVAMSDAASPPHQGLARETVTVVIDGAEQELGIVRQDCINGGQQAYWLCPQCSALRSHLYAVNGVLACRVCHRLDYRSRHVLHPALIRAAKLRRKLGAAPGLLSALPRRPQRWRRDYWARALAALVAAEASIAVRLRDTVEQVRRRKR